LLALLSGIGGGNFACSMSNISTFFPKRLQGTALGMNAGLGNFGVTTMQILIPLVMTAGVFGALAGGPMALAKDSGWILGKITAGTMTWIQNAGFVWLLFLIPLAFLGFFGMNNLLVDLAEAIGSTIAAFIKVLWLYGLAFLHRHRRSLSLPAGAKAGGLGLLNMWVALPLIIGAAPCWS
jgi:NNP family nitrate/nitrite transporter-like MFS transporter